MEAVTKKIVNSKKCGVILGEVLYTTTGNVERYISVIDDWYNAMQFEFDTKEQIEELIDILTKLKERWS